MTTRGFLWLDGLPGTWFWLCILRSLLGIRAGSPARQRSLFTGRWPWDLGRGRVRLQGGDICLQRSGKALRERAEFLSAPSYIPLGQQWSVIFHKLANSLCIVFLILHWIKPSDQGSKIVAVGAFWDVSFYTCGLRGYKAGFLSGPLMASACWLWNEFL